MDPETGLDSVLSDDAPELTSGPSDSPAAAEGESLSEIIAAVEGELAGETKKPVDADPTAAPVVDPALAVRLERQELELTQLRQLVQSLSTPAAPDPERAAEALVAEIRADGDIVAYNREIEGAEAAITSLTATSRNLASQIGQAQDLAAEYRGQLKIAADDNKPAIEARLEAAQAKIERLQTEYSANQRDVSATSREKTHLEKQLHRRVDEIKTQASQRSEEQATEDARVRSDQAAFNYAIGDAEKKFKVTLNKTDKDFVRKAVGSLIRESDNPNRFWTPEQIARATFLTARRYLINNNRTAGSRAVALSPSKAPSAPRPADRPMNGPAPRAQAQPTAEQESDPQYWKDRARLIRERQAQVRARR